MTVTRTTTTRMPRRCALLAVLGVMAICAACGGPDPSRRAARAEIMSDAAADSLGLVAFVALTEDERALRRERATTWLQYADDTGDTWGRAQALQTATGLAPDDPVPWLDLAETVGGLGDVLRVDAVLDNATESIRHLNEPESDLRVSRRERDKIVLRAALLRAWYHYGRAEWHEGLSWARAALQVSPGSDGAAVIKGLLEAAVQHRPQAEAIAEDLHRRDQSDRHARWIRIVLDQAEGHLVSAFNLATQAGPPDEHVAEFWRDKACVAEQKGEWAYARRWYDESGAALPPGAARYRKRVDHSRCGEPAAPVEMPVWIASNRYYLTGSRSAYTALVFERFDTATTTEERTLWGGETVNAAGIMLRLRESHAWALRARGLVFLDQGNLVRARTDLERAERRFAEEDKEDRLVVAGLGRLWLQHEDHKRALPYLERAVLLSPTESEGWSDLGLGRVMAQDETGAAQAFGRALELDPTAVTAWYNRGLMRLHAGELDAAAADLGEAARLAPDNAEVARLLQRIRLMQRGSGPDD